MENLATWPTNKYGTSWRYATFYFDWQDKEPVMQAIEAIDPLTIRMKCRPVTAVGVMSEADMMILRLADALPFGKGWDVDNLTVVDPCTDPEATENSVRERLDNVAFTAFGLASLDLADETIYEILMAAFDDRRERFVGEYPAIDFNDHG